MNDDDDNSQEAEDVARLIEKIHNFFTPPNEHDEVGLDVAEGFLEPLLASLVREGQIRKLTEAVDDYCFMCACEAHEEQRRPTVGSGGTWWHGEGEDEEPCGASPLYARIAALRQEG